MKLKGFILSAIAVVMAFSACEQKENLGTPDISISESEIEFGVDGGDQTIVLKATRDWSVQIDADWVAVDPDAGEASSTEQVVTISTLKNSGLDREASVKFTIGMKSKYLTVTQKGPEGSAAALVMYSNDFDASKASKVNDQWPLLKDSYDQWDNKKGSDVSAVTYAFGGKMSVRTSGKASNDASGFSHYAGSGVNKIFFGTATSIIKIQGISLDPSNTTYKLSFGGQKYGQEAASNVFSWDEFKVYVGGDAQKWVPVTMAFPADADTDGDWNLASASFTVPTGTTALGIAFVCSASSLYSIDDVLLEVGTEAGQMIDFANGIEISGTTEGSGTGSGSGDNTGDLPEGTGEGTEASPYDAAKATRVAGALDSEAKVTGVYVKGKVKSIKELNTQYGNATYYITDADGIANFYVYRGKNVGNTSFTSADQLAVGDEVIIYGDLMNYMGNSPQLGQGNYIVTRNAGSGSEGGETPAPVEKPSSLAKVTIAEFIAAPVSSDTWYELTGEIISIEAGNKYGNFTIKDSTGEVYIYGMTSQWVGNNDQSFESLGLKETDVVTLGTLRGEYNGQPQGGGNTVPAYYISHVPGAGLPDDPTGTVVLTFPAATQESVNSYGVTWAASIGDMSWSFAHFNNNQNKWSYIKCGHKTTDYVATISTTKPMAVAVAKVVVSVDNLLDASKVTSTKLEVATDAAFSNIVDTVEKSISKGSVEYVVSAPQTNCYYRLTYDTKASGGSSNGTVQISKVKYIAAQ